MVPLSSGHVFFSVVGSLFLIIYVEEMYFYLVDYLAFSRLNDISEPIL